MRANFYRVLNDKYPNMVFEAYTKLIDAVKDMGYTSEDDVQNMSDSPARCTKGFLELIKPKAEIAELVKQMMKDFDTDYTGMVMAQNIIVFSICPHHFLPVIYRITVAYLPKQTRSRVLGISKLARLAELLASRPVLQETLTTDISETLCINKSPNHKFTGLASHGAAATVEGIHLCMASRGVKKHEARIITQKLCGEFLKSGDLRSEYMGLVQSNRPQNLL